MSKRKETRTCTYAYRNKETKILTEFKLIEYDGEGDDFISLLKDMVAASSSLTLEDAQIQCAKFMREAGFTCETVKITFVDEKQPES